MLFSLQIAQIFLAILPGEPLEILAGMCYGGIGGTIFILVSVFVTTTADAINSRDGVIELSDEAVSEYESLYEN